MADPVLDLLREQHREVTRRLDSIETEARETRRQMTEGAVQFAHHSHLIGQNSKAVERLEARVGEQSSAHRALVVRVGAIEDRHEDEDEEQGEVKEEKRSRASGLWYPLILAIAAGVGSLGMWLIQKVVPVLLVVALLAGCGSTRETAKAVVQADQAAEGQQRLLADPKVAEVLAQLTPEQRAVLERTFRKLATLGNAIRGSLAPAITLLSAGQPVEVETTVEEAVERPETFARKAAVQAGRAQVEAEAYVRWHRWLDIALDFGGEIAGSLLSQLLLGLGITAGTGAAGGLVMRARKLARVARAAIAYGVDASRAFTEEDLKQVQDKHAREQQEQGIHDEIAREVARAKRARKGAA